LAFVLLAGCASTQAVLDKDPTYVLVSKQPPVAVASCIASRNDSHPEPRDDGSTVVLIKNNLYDAVSSAFVIWPDGTGSRVEYRRSFIAVGEQWRNCL
jgi:hypothetical protein